MGVPEIPAEVKLFVAILYQHESFLNKTILLLEKRYGDIDQKSDPFPFDITDYYHDEMGPDLSRVFVSFRNLVMADRLPEVKLVTNDIENELAGKNGRTVNLDCGYLDYYKVVLASTKVAGPKVYLSDGIYADITLRYEKGKFYPYDWRLQISGRDGMKSFF